MGGTANLCEVLHSQNEQMHSQVLLCSGVDAYAALRLDYVTVLTVMPKFA